MWYWFWDLSTGFDLVLGFYGIGFGIGIGVLRHQKITILKGPSHNSFLRMGNVDVVGSGSK